jgi:hypothetical protein
MLGHLLFETPLMVFADIMVAVWVGLVIVLQRIPIAFFTAVLGVDALLFIAGIVDFVLHWGSREPWGSRHPFGPDRVFILLGNFATGLTCCALLAGLTVLGDAIMRGSRNRQQDVSVRPPA